LSCETMTRIASKQQASKLAKSKAKLKARPDRMLCAQGRRGARC